MRRLRIVLLVVGILFLVAGVYFQDGVADGVVIAFNVISRSQGSPSWADLNGGYEFSQARARTGLVLKLTGFAILLSLFFVTLRREGGRKNRNTLLPSLLGLGSGICFAVSLVLAPTAKIAWWALTKALIIRLPSGLDTRGLSELLNARLAEGINSVTGAIVLAVGLFLLAAALVSYRRGIGKSISISLVAPSLFIFLAQGRQVLERRFFTYFDVVPIAGVFLFIAIAFGIVAIAIFIRALIVRKKAPEKMLLLTVALLVITGCLAVGFWVTSLVKIGAIHSSSPLYRMYQPAPSDITQWYFPLVVSASLFYGCLMLCAVFLPILCALSLKRSPDQTVETKPTGKPVFPLIAGVLTLIAFAVAGFFGLHENRFKTALRNVAHYGPQFRIEREKDRPREVQSAMDVFESEEGLQFLRETMNAPGEYYWHEFVALYMWQYIRNPKSQEFFFDMLLDESHPIASAWAAGVIVDALDSYPDSYPITKGISEDAFLSYISRRPELGSRFFEIATKAYILRSSLVYEILKTCSNAGVEKLSFHAKIGARPGEILELPEGFTVYLPQKAPVNRSIFSVNLSWSESEKYETSYHLHSKVRHGRVELYAGGKKVGYITDQYGTKMPDYQELSEIIKRAKNASGNKSGSGAFLVEVKIDPIVPSYHVMHFLNACARAGITEVSIAEP